MSSSCRQEAPRELRVQSEAASKKAELECTHSVCIPEMMQETGMMHGYIRVTPFLAGEAERAREGVDVRDDLRESGRGSGGVVAFRVLRLLYGSPVHSLVPSPLRRKDGNMS